MLASARGKESGVIIWNPQTGEEVRIIGKKENLDRASKREDGAQPDWFSPIKSVAFSPDGKWLAIGWQITDKKTDTSRLFLRLVDAGTGNVAWQQTVPASPKGFVARWEKYRGAL